MKTMFDFCGRPQSQISLLVHLNVLIKRQPIHHDNRLRLCIQFLWPSGPSRQNTSNKLSFIFQNTMACHLHPGASSVNSKPPPPPPGDPRDSHVLTARGVGFLHNFLCPGRGFEFEKFSAVLKGKYRNFSICSEGTGGVLLLKHSVVLNECTKL